MTYTEEFRCPCGCLQVVYTWEGQAADGSPQGNLLDIEFERGMRKVQDDEGDLIWVPIDACPTGVTEGDKMIKLRKERMV